MRWVVIERSSWAVSDDFSTLMNRWYFFVSASGNVWRDEPFGGSFYRIANRRRVFHLGFNGSLIILFI